MFYSNIILDKLINFNLITEALKYDIKIWGKYLEIHQSNKKLEENAQTYGMEFLVPKVNVCFWPNKLFGFYVSIFLLSCFVYNTDFVPIIHWKRLYKKTKNKIDW